MATVVFSGVPFFGPDLRRQSAERAAMLKAWIEFYERNRVDLTTGEFQPYGDLNHPDQVIERGHRAYVYYAHPSPAELDLAHRAYRVTIVNASTSSSLALTVNGLMPGPYEATISDRFLTPDQPRSLVLQRSSTLRFDVPVGCLLTLSRTSDPSMR
jgi:hypothetical protein